MNGMFTVDPLMAQQVKGLVVCVPKKPHPECIGDFRPLTLLNADYKILARVIANRMQPIIQDRIHSLQHCGGQGTSIFDAVATIRDAIAHSEITRKPLCVIAIDFQAAFDRVSHRYMERALQAHGFDDTFTQRIMGLYRNATSEVQINGFRSNCFPINCSIRQGCPLSMMLYALCINPLLHKLEEALNGVRIRRRSPTTAVVAYADDVTVLLTDRDEAQTLQDVLGTYENATGAKINTSKTKALAIGGWDTSQKIMDIEYPEEIRILGVNFTNRSTQTCKEHWCRIISHARAVAQEAYHRNISLEKRIQFVHVYMLARIWYSAQIFPIPTDGIRQLNTAISWFLWKGEIFRVPLSTLQRAKAAGGWDLLNIWAKSRALYIRRLRAQRQREGTVTADWMATWNISTAVPNPPHFTLLPTTLDYLRVYILDAAYTPVQGNTETFRTYKTRIYTSLKSISNAASPAQEMRIIKMKPHINWDVVWENLTATPVPNHDVMTWYRVIHDIIPTKTRLNRIRMTNTDACSACGKSDTLEHRLITCGEGTSTWEWLQSRIARIMRTSAARVPSEWLLHPHFKLWPPQRHRAVLWMLAHYVTFRVNNPPTLTSQDLMDFLRRSKWKTYTRNNRRETVANFLVVLDTPY